MKLIHFRYETISIARILGNVAIQDHATIDKLIAEHQSKKRKVLVLDIKNTQPFDASTLNFFKAKRSERIKKKDVDYYLISQNKAIRDATSAQDALVRIGGMEAKRIATILISQGRLQELQVREMSLRLSISNFLRKQLEEDETEEPLQEEDFNVYTNKIRTRIRKLHILSATFSRELDNLINIRNRTKRNSNIDAATLQELNSLKIKILAYSAD